MGGIKMSNLSLYNITNKFVELFNEAQEGELTEQEYNELGQELAKELQNKSSSIIAYIRNSELLIDAMKTEEKKIEKFKNYVKENMEKLDIKEISTELGKLAIAKNPISIEIENEDEIPAEFKEEITTIKIDKTKIKNYFKETGEIVAGTKVVDNKTNLRVR